MKPIKIGSDEIQKNAYEVHKSKKLQHYERAYNLCSKYVIITDEDLFRKNFLNYTFKASKEKLNLPYIDLNDWIKFVGFNTVELNQIQKSFDCFAANIDPSAADPDFNIYITTDKQKKVYEQLQLFCEILNKHPEHIDLFFNGTNQFSKCIERKDGKAEINALWISQIC
jgi:hypothetical protein